VDRRAVVRLALLTAAAAGAVTMALHLDHGGADAPAAPSSTFVAAPGQTAPPVTLRADAQADLERTLIRPATRGTDVGAAADPMTDPTADPRTADLTVVVDESAPHTHVVDPDTGRLISVAGAQGVVGNAKDLGPVHQDPTPRDVSLGDPTDTGSLLSKAGLSASASTLPPETPSTADTAAPPGSPIITSLNQHVAPSCSGTGTDGNRVQPLYVHEAHTASRFPQVLNLLRNEVANVDDVFALSAQQTGGVRRVRWVHDSSCVPKILDVTVPNGALGSDFWGTVDALKNLGYDDPHRKYLMFADANVFCGIGSLYDDARATDNANDGRYASYSRVDANCWSSRSSSVPAHELTHNLGGVLAGAPHATVNGHCFDDYDIMCYDDGSGVPMQRICSSVQEQLLDCNHDDYFNTSPVAGSFLARNWNTARSSFLDHTLTAGEPPGPSSSSPIALTWTKPVVTGKTIGAVLRDDGGAGLAGRSVVLQAKWQGSDQWVSVRTLTTGAGGRASTTATYPRAGWLRFTSPGDPAFGSATSQAVLVKVATQLLSGHPSAHQVTGTLRTSSGQRISQATIVLQRRTAGTSRWVTAATLRTRADGTVSRTVHPGSKTAFFRWEFHGDSDHAAARSASVSVG
jgi:hypothetical protein